MTKPIKAADFTKETRPDILDFVPAKPRARHDGWSGERQHLFIAALAETGCVTEAAAQAGVTVQSVYRLRLRPDAVEFDRAWRLAQQVAVNRLTALAFERAIHGTPRGIWHKGERVGEEYVPSDRLLAFLLQRLDRRRFGVPGETGAAGEGADPVEAARAALPGLLWALDDIDETVEAPKTFLHAPESTIDERVHWSRARLRS